MRVFFVLALIGANILVYSYAFQSRELTVRFLDVGQGDSILIESPTGVQMLIDGGVDSSVLRELGRALPFYDRSIDVVVATHPDKDHIGGLIDVLERYDVATIIESGVQHDSSTFRTLTEKIQSEPGADKYLARRGMRLALGGGVYADILFPDREVTNVETNTGSVIMKVTYGMQSFLLTGDAPSSVEKYLVLLDGDNLESSVLKAGHHGSRTSTSEEFIEAVNPNVVVVSAGKDNSYGHPHAEVLENIKESGAAMLSTIDRGTIIFRSNSYALKYNE